MRNVTCKLIYKLSTSIRYSLLITFYIYVSEYIFVSAKSIKYISYSNVIIYYSGSSTGVGIHFSAGHAYVSLLPPYTAALETAWNASYNVIEKTPPELVIVWLCYCR